MSQVCLLKLMFFTIMCSNTVVYIVLEKERKLKQEPREKTGVGKGLAQGCHRPHPD